MYDTQTGTTRATGPNTDHAAARGVSHEQERREHSGRLNLGLLDKHVAADASENPILPEGTFINERFLERPAATQFALCFHETARLLALTQLVLSSIPGAHETEPGREQGTFWLTDHLSDSLFRLRDALGAAHLQSAGGSGQAGATL